MKADEKKCPACAETIKVDAKVCRYCSHQFSDDEVAQAQHAASNKKLVGCFLPVVIGAVIVYWVGSTLSSNAPGSSASSSSNLTGSASAPAAKRWEYGSSTDKMRGSTDKWATIDSDNEVNMDFPYNGGVTAHISVRTRKQDGTQVLFFVDKGQIQCSEYNSNHRLHVKFDDGKIGAYSCSNSSDGSNETAFFEAPSAMLAKLKKSKRVMVEAEMFDNGPRQWTFNTAGLKW